jgi:hypothetical protein
MRLFAIAILLQRPAGEPWSAPPLGALDPFIDDDGYYTTTAACNAAGEAAKVPAMKAKDMGASEIAKVLKIGRASVYRALEGA